MPQAVPPAGVQVNEEGLGWTPEGLPDAWPQGSYLNCCFHTSCAPVMNKTMQAGYGILTHNYAPSALRWCDIFEVDCKPDRSWLPLEDLGCSTEQTAASDTDSVPNGPPPLVLAAYSARTLQARLDGAKAALREGGPAAATDARLLLTECLPGMTAAAKLKALIGTADAAMAAAKEEAAHAPGTVGVQAFEHDGQQCLEDDVTACEKAAVRALVALFMCHQQHTWEGDADAAAEWVTAGMRRVDAWLQARGISLLLGMDSGNEVLPAWCRFESNTNFAQLLKDCKSMCEGHLSFVSCTMASHYSLFFAAYAAKHEPGGGPKGRLVKRALASIKQVDPEGWVPRLLAGLEFADATLQPSFMLGSKQEAMACCSMLGRCWQRLDSGGRQCYSSAVQRVCKDFGVLTEQSYSMDGTPVDVALTQLVQDFNTGSLRCHNLQQHPAVVQAGDAMKQMTALRAHVLVLMALGRATVNLPPIITHWQHWQGSEAVKLLGTSNASRTAAALLVNVNLHSLGIASSPLGAYDNIAVKDIEIVKQQTARLEAAAASLQTHKARWLWQAGKAAAALAQLRSCAQQIAQQSCAELYGPHSQQLDEVIGFLEAEVHQQQQQQQQEQQQQQASSAASAQAAAECGSSSPCADAILERGGSIRSGNQDLWSSHHSSSTDGSNVDTAVLDTGSVVGSAAISCLPQPAAGPAASSSSGGSSTDNVHPGEPPAAAAALISSGKEPSGCSGARPQLGKPCAQCGGLFAKLKRCAGCGEVRYCSSACQRLHWRAGHQTECRRHLLADAGLPKQQSDQA